MESTACLDLPLIQPSQAQKHVTHNEAIALLDALVMLAVASRSLGEPALPAAEGDRYIVPPGGAGAFEGHDGEVAAFVAGAWVYAAPRAGWLAWCIDEARFLAHDGTGFAPLSTDEVPRLGINTAPDDTNRLAVRSDAALLTSDTGSCRLSVNKETSGDTASLVFQTAYSGRAEMGLAGNDDFSIKVAAGGAWRTAIAADADNAFVGIGTPAPRSPLHVSHAGFAGVVEMWIEDTVNENVAFRLRHAGCLNNGFDFGMDSTEAVVLNLRENAAMRFQTNNTERMRLSAEGALGIGVSQPTCLLHVAGPMRIEPSPEAGLPAASGAGAGAMAYVPDHAGAPALAVSDGAAWRFVALPA